MIDVNINATNKINIIIATKLTQNTMYCKMSTKSTHNHHHNHHHMVWATVQQRRRYFSFHPATKIRTDCCWLLAIMTTISLLVLVNCDHRKIGGTPVQEKLASSQSMIQEHDSHSVDNFSQQYNLRDKRAADRRSYAEYGERLDICATYCSCDNTTNSLSKITCDFRSSKYTDRTTDPIFGKKFKVPPNITSIRIIMAKDYSLTLDQGFLDNNIVNELIIEGFNSRNTQVEIRRNAFSGNRGPFPKIVINHVFSVIVRSGAFLTGGCNFTVRNAMDVELEGDSFSNTSLIGHFEHIEDLRIMENAFNAATAILLIKNSHIDNLYRFGASLHEICFINCTIGTINAGTFDVYKIDFIRFEYCQINTIKSKAITEKLFSKHVSIKDAKIGVIEGEAIYGSGITELVLIRNNIEKIQANAIHVTAANVKIAENNINILDNDWLRVQHWNNIIVAKNSFGTFGHMLLEETSQNATCHFEENFLTKPLRGSLNIHCTFRNITIDMPCSCNTDWLYEISTHDLRSETFCTMDQKLDICFNVSIFNTLKYLNEAHCYEKNSTLKCVANRTLIKTDENFFTPEEFEHQFILPRKINMLELLGILFLIILIVIACITIYHITCPHCKASRGGINNISNVGIVSDHLHEFSMEDRHIIEQSLQLMQKKYPKTYKKINTEMKVLLQNDLSDKKCRKVIIEIVNLLNNVSSTCDEFAPFNNILAQHLQPQIPSAPPTDPIYTEPTLTGVDFYTLNMAQGAYTVNASTPAAATTILNNHIYAEPNCVQQPLLPNDYASPVDINMDANDPYMEPVNERGSNLPSAFNATLPSNPPSYSTTSTRCQHHRLPSIPSAESGTHSAANHLPDVLHQSLNTQVTNKKQLTNVQKMAQDFQNMPKFHINQLVSSANSPRPHNLHLVAPPIYTAPDISQKQQQHRNIINQIPVPMARLASPEAVDECELDMRGAAALPPDSGSDHSGGSDETVKIDDVIEYVDA